MRKRWRWFAAIAAASMVLVILAALFHRIFDVIRGTPLLAMRASPALEQPPALADVRFIDVVAPMAETSFAGGHQIEILVTPAASFGRLFADLRRATRSITFQSYYCLPGGISDSTASILGERARAGVRVLFLADGFGCSEFAEQYGAALRGAGAEVAVLRPVHWYAPHKAQHRSHVRFVVIDGAAAYTGGFGLDDKWADRASGRPGWRDTNVRFTGPAVRQAQGAFFTAWAEATRTLVAGTEFFPADSGDGGDVTAAIQYAGPGLGTTPFERLLFLTVTGARERLYITNPYFVPNAAQRRLLTSAAARGVDVRVLTAGRNSDVPSTRLAARGYYGELLRAGVRVFEYTPSMIHAKTMVADGVWSIIGTMNLDNRSLRLNDETNLLVYDRATAHELERVFAADLARSNEVTLNAFADRPLRDRFVEQLVKVIAPLL